jgi:hypothetical protein
MMNSRYWPSVYSWRVPAKSENLLSIQTNFDSVIIGAKIPINRSIVDSTNRILIRMSFFGWRDARVKGIKVVLDLAVYYLISVLKLFLYIILHYLFIAIRRPGNKQQ